MKRCDWALGSDAEKQYHDEEWGVPLHDDQRLFEFLILEGAQAGLSWSTILNKRRGYRRAFDDFEVQKIAGYTVQDTKRLIADTGIIRNRLKIEAAIKNARAFINIQESFGSFDRYLWQFVDGQPVQNRWRTMAEIPAQTDLSQTLSKDLKRRGFKFVGPTICYAFMQAVGLVNDHITSCFRYQEVAL